MTTRTLLTRLAIPALLGTLWLGCAPPENATPAAGGDTASGSSLAALSAATVAGAPELSARTVPYTCADGQRITATYVSADSGAASVVILRWNGQSYGLAQAVSGSGARYAGLYGPTVSDHGLEWWEAKGEATLSGFTGKDFFETRPLVAECRPEA